MILNKLLSLKNAKNNVCVALIFVMSLVVTSCSKEPEPTPEAARPPAETPADLKSYEKNGLAMKYPANWEFLYDNEPDLYAFRGVGFQISEFSNVRLLIDPSQSLKLPALADRFEKELQLKSNNIASDYTRAPTKFGQYKAEKLSWVDKAVGSTKFELTIVTVSEAPVAIYAVTHLSEADIAKETKYIDFFVQSISYKNTGVATNQDK
ncbi:MAG: hypothetical protein EOO52_11380 [Gammaproteobacteria bacterium]|nr:MAG: hypothetical protein EOO52_11380 [Gammaproteobacteria bacterium]